MSGAGVIEIGELAEMLNRRAGELAPHLLPNGRKIGAFWRTGNIADDRGQSLAVNLAGARPGWWTDFSASEGMRDRSGDMLSLVAQVLFGGDLARAIPWAKSWLGLDELDPARLATVRAEATRRRVDADREAKRRAEWMRRQAQALFLDPRARPIVDTPAELYLAGRGIDLSVLGRVSKALAFHPAVHNKEADAALPALIARVLDGKGVHVATHRTWIEADIGPGGGATGLWRKARLAEPKMALGGFLGGYIPLNKGACRETLARIPAGTAIATSEGIEDGMTVACACPELRVLAAVSLDNIANLPLPDPRGPGAPGPVTIVGQNDPAGSPAAKALDKVVEKLAARGFTVAIARPPEGVKDANDMVEYQAEEAA